MVVFVAVALTAARPAAAQQPMQRQVDSLAAQVRALRARLDSLVRRTPTPADTSEDLASLRAAAAAAAGTDTSKPKSETGPFIGRERNQAQLNPEIGVTGDVRAYGQQPGVQRDNFDPREFEIGFQSALDPYSSTKIFVSLENGDVSIAEG